MSFFPGVKWTKNLSLIFILSPDEGFIPILDFLSLVERLPKSLISILLPLDKLDEKNCNIFSKVLSTSLLEDTRISFLKLEVDQIFSLLGVQIARIPSVNFNSILLNFFKNFRLISSKKSVSSA